MNPATLHPFQRNILIVVFSTFVVAAVITALWVFLKKNKLDIVAKKVLIKISTFCFTLGFVGWVLFFMRQFHVYFFSRRFWLIFWSIGAVVWFFYLLKYILKKAPTEKKEVQEKKDFEKYLPKKRK